MDSKQAHQDYGVINLDLNLEPSSPAHRLVVTIGDDHRIGRDREEAQAKHPCSFCERKFRSKQALGGHQNAHRLVPHAGTRKRRRQVAPSSSTSSSSPVPEPALAIDRLHAGSGELREAYDSASVADGPVVDWNRAWCHENVEPAAEPELDLSLKLWSG